MCSIKHPFSPIEKKTLYDRDVESHQDGIFIKIAKGGLVGVTFRVIRTLKQMSVSCEKDTKLRRWPLVNTLKRKQFLNPPD